MNNRCVHVLAAAKVSESPGVVLGIFPNHKTQTRHPSIDKTTISTSALSFPSPFPFSGVGKDSVLNSESMVPGPSTASGHPGPSGPPAPEPVEEG